MTIRTPGTAIQTCSSSGQRKLRFAETFSGQGLDNLYNGVYTNGMMIQEDRMNKIERVRAGFYRVGIFEVERDDEPCNGTYGLWNVFEVDGNGNRREWCIDCSTLRDAKRWIDGKVEQTYAKRDRLEAMRRRDAWAFAQRIADKA